MISYRTFRIMCWQTTVDHFLNILPFRFRELPDSTFFVEYESGASGSRKWMWNMGITFLVQFLLNSYLILQTYFNYIDIPNMILSLSISVSSLFTFFAQVFWMLRIKPLILLLNNIFELNAHLGKAYWSGLFRN
jgi:hypothetical protein